MSAILIGEEIPAILITKEDTKAITNLVEFLTTEMTIKMRVDWVDFKQKDCFKFMFPEMTRAEISQMVTAINRAIKSDVE